VIRGGFAATRSQTCHTMTVDESTWVIPGLDFQIGDRIASTSGAIQRAGIDVLFVDQVEEMSLSGKGDGSRLFLVKIGLNKAAMTLGERFARAFKKALDAITDIGVHLIN